MRRVMIYSRPQFTATPSPTPATSASPTPSPSFSLSPSPSATPEPTPTPLAAYLYGWGGNGYGQIGNNSTANQVSAVQTTIATNVWRTVSDTIDGSTYGIKDDLTLWAFGYNAYGQLGNNSTALVSTPVQVFGTNASWVNVNGGLNHVIAIKTNGSLWTWGKNTSGQLGINSTTNQSSPTQVSYPQLWEIANAGQTHTLGLAANNTLWSWGGNAYGELGNSASTTASTPIQIGTATNWKTITAGFQNSYAIKTDGSLWGWGRNDKGQLAQNDIVNRSSPVQIGAGSTWVLLAAGNGFLLATKNDNSLWVVGDNTFGQLGISSQINRSSLTQVSALSNQWISVSAGYQFSVALRGDSSAWAWGRNLYNALGNITNNSQTSVSTPVQVTTTGLGWIALTAGGYHVSALTQNTPLPTVSPSPATPTPSASAPAATPSPTPSKTVSPATPTPTPSVSVAAATPTPSASGGTTPLTGGGACSSAVSWPAYGSGNKYSVTINTTPQWFTVSGIRTLFATSQPNDIEVRYNPPNNTCSPLGQLKLFAGTLSGAGYGIQQGGSNGDTFGLNTFAGSETLTLWIV